MSRVYVFGSPRQADLICINFAYHRDMVTLIQYDRDLLGQRFEVGDRLIGNSGGWRVARQLSKDRVKLDYAGYVVADD